MAKPEQMSQQCHRSPAAGRGGNRWPGQIKAGPQGTARTALTALTARTTRTTLTALTGVIALTATRSAPLVLGEPAPPPG